MANLPLDMPFDYQLAMDRLGDYTAPRDKLRRLCASGAICRVKKGLYSPLKEGRLVVDRLVLSGLIYGPSYVSRETALSLHGMIPERVEEITCMTTKRNKQFRTPAGRFSYRLMPRAAFHLGVSLAQGQGGGYFLAGPEKALCDRVAGIRDLHAIADVEALLFEDLRIDEARLAALDRSLIREIAAAYGRRNVLALGKWLEKRTA